MKKTAVTVLSLLITSMGINIHAQETSPSEDIIITDNFTVVDSSKKNGGKDLLRMTPENTLGSLGKRKTVIVGEKSPNHIAFVKSAHGRNYIIENSIMVQCRKGVNCIPDGITSIKMGQSIYQVTAADYDNWKSLQQELKNTPDVRKVTPIFYYGKKPKLK
ncbi:MAG: hypothetical protein II944_06210 [Ruminobacter sp.]|nr:hypothetical protein [Ruminobacter sp.]